jgi:CheY-like chemotaxis protein
MARILVVDDEPFIAMMAEDWLDELGHEVVGPATDLAGALALAEQPLDGAILDVSLGAEKCYPVATRLAERGIPYALATGHATEALDKGFENALKLQKPYGFEGFCKVLDELLAEPRASAAPPE